MSFYLIWGFIEKNACEVFFLFCRLDSDQEFHAQIPFFLKRDEIVAIELLRSRNFANPSRVLDILAEFPEARMLFLEECFLETARAVTMSPIHL